MSDAPSAPPRPWRVAISGSSGLVGSALATTLEREGHEVVRMVRSRAGGGEIHWDPARGEIDAAGLRGVTAVVHLAGENLARRWTPEAKRRIRESRVQGTHLLAAALASLPDRPNVLVSASAVGYYGDRGDEPLTEASAPGSDFLAGVVRDWEAAAAPAADAGIRVVHPRLGVVLSRRGGALARLLPVFRLGAGGRLGSGAQWMSWVSLHDVLDTVRFVIGDPAIHGAINATAPHPVTNAEFTHTLGEILDRPTFVPVPKLALRLLYGEMADATLFASQRARPDRLVEAGYTFRHPRLADALRAALSEPA